MLKNNKGCDLYILFFHYDFHTHHGGLGVPLTSVTVAALSGRYSQKLELWQLSAVVPLNGSISGTVQSMNVTVFSIQIKCICQ